MELPVFSKELSKNVRELVHFVTNLMTLYPDRSKPHLTASLQWLCTQL
jgi:hypothetical protein